MTNRSEVTTFYKTLRSFKMYIDHSFLDFDFGYLSENSDSSSKRINYVAHLKPHSIIVQSHTSATPYILTFMWLGSLPEKSCI